MNDQDIKTTQEKGPFVYENWRAALAGVSWRDAFEYPLFTDAHIFGDISEGCGPYKLWNTCIDPRTRQFRPALVLYVENHLSNEPAQMDETDEERYHGGLLEDEIAALVSLCLGIRIKAGGESRIFGIDGDPKGRPIAWGFTQDPVLPKVSKKPILPRVLGTHCLEDTAMLAELPALSPKDAIALVRAARLYQEAVWIAESTPELSWIMLTSAVETAASRWRAAMESPLDRLRASMPDLENLLRKCGGKELVSQVAERLAPYMGSTRKFVDFILEFLSEPPAVRPNFNQHPWELKAMEKAMIRIYDYRSRALHGGKPFPAPMCMPPMRIGDQDVLTEVPGCLAMSTRGGVWVAQDIPMLLQTFEYIVRHAILKWWQSMLEKSLGDQGG